MEDLIELNVVGVSRSQIQQGAYALILEEVGGKRRIPIVVGMSEAQSIAVRLQSIIPPRPLTHDLMTSAFHAFGIELSRVVITTFEDGVFSSELHLKGSQVETVLDSRTSDAIGLALRTNARIYTTPDIIARTSFTPDDNEIVGDDDDMILENMPIDRLQARMQHHIDCEEYEEAGRIKKIIESRTGAK